MFSRNEIHTVNYRFLGMKRLKNAKTAKSRGSGKITAKQPVYFADEYTVRHVGLSLIRIDA